MTTYTKKLFIASLALLAVSCSGSGNGSGNGEASQSTATSAKIAEVNKVFGIPSDGYTLSHGQVHSGETMGKILNNYGVSASDIFKLERNSKEVFPLNKIRGGNKYTAFTKGDSLSTKLDYLVYEQNLIDYVVFSFASDSIYTYKGQNPTKTRRICRSATIESSMWGAIMDAKLPYSLAAEVEDIYQWTVDFFAIQKGDNFTVIFDEKFVQDTIPVGIGRVWGAKFAQGEQTYYAIPFAQNDEVEYWEDNGASLRKQMLKAPLKYSRISSGFSYSRLHPIYKTYRPHTGVDYAAPAGTEVHSVADGTVIFKGWGGGGGNTLKIKHPGNITTGYLHLRGYAKGIVQGSKVKQGQLIGYVGSTGASTGPHLDYRVWQGTKPINPLKIPQKPSEPIAEQNKAAFEDIKTRIIAELEGTIEPGKEVKESDIAPKVETANEQSDSPKEE